MTTQTQIRNEALHWFLTIIAVLFIGSGVLFASIKIANRYTDKRLKNFETIINDKIDVRVDTRVEEYLNDSIGFKLDSLLEISNQLLMIE